MDTEAYPSRLERAYAVVVVVMVVLFFGSIGIAGFVKDGVLDRNQLRTESMYFLAYIGTISIALWVGRLVAGRLIKYLKHGLVRSAICIGIPLFALPTFFHWVFSSHLLFSEHLASNLLLSVLISWSLGEDSALSH